MHNFHVSIQSFAFTFTYCEALLACRVDKAKVEPEWDGDARRYLIICWLTCIAYFNLHSHSKLEVLGGY